MVLFVLACCCSLVSPRRPALRMSKSSTPYDTVAAPPTRSSYASLLQPRRRRRQLHLSAAPEDDRPLVPLSPVRQAACVGSLLALFTVNQWSRSLIFYLVDFTDRAGQPAAAVAEASRAFMNVELGFDQAQYGLLASLGFAAVFSFASFLAGLAVDKADARTLLPTSGVLWSLAMLWQAAASSFGDVLGSRFLLGFSQAFCNPAAYVALGRISAPSSRATVLGVYSSGVYIGGGLAALSILLDGPLGWRGVSQLAGATGVGVALIAAVALPSLPPVASEGREEAAGEEAATAQQVGALSSLRDDLSELLAPPVVRWLLAASALRFLAGFALGVWVVPFYRGAPPRRSQPRGAAVCC